MNKKIIIRFLTTGKTVSVWDDGDSNLYHIKKAVENHYNEINNKDMYRVYLDDGVTKDMCGYTLKQFIWGLRNLNKK